MASPNTIKANLAVRERSEEVQKQLNEKYAISHPSLPKTSMRWHRRSKGQPYGRMMLKGTHPSAPGKPAVLRLVHPTRGTVLHKVATPSLIATFFPTIPPMMADALLGRF